MLLPLSLGERPQTPMQLLSMTFNSYFLEVKNIQSGFCSRNKVKNRSHNTGSPPLFFLFYLAMPHIHFTTLMFTMSK